MKSNTNRFFTGILLIGLGIVFLLHQTGNLQFNLGDLIWTYWPVIIIYFSLAGLLFDKKVNSGWSGSFVWNLFGLVVGLYFLGRNLGLIDLSIGQIFPYVIPIMLILFGISIVFKPSSRDKSFTHTGSAAEPSEEPMWTDSDYTSSSYSHDWSSTDSSAQQHSWFNDVHLGQTAWELKPTNISHFVGDTVIDMTKAYIPIGETKINISSFIGDVKIFVPNDPELELLVVSSSFLGDSTVLDKHEGGMFRSFETRTPGYDDGLKKVRIHVSSFIGDLRVQRVG